AEDDTIDRARHLTEARVGSETVDLWTARIDRINFAGESVTKQRRNDLSAEPGRIRGCSDDGDGLRREQSADVLRSRALVGLRQVEKRKVHAHGVPCSVLEVQLPKHPCN